MLDTSSIKPYEKNAKKHPEKQIKQLADIIQEVGWRQPVVVNQQGIIIVGHGRWATWQKYGERLKPIWIIDDAGNTINGEPDRTPMTEEQEKAYRLADNKLNESDWDMDLVLGELKEIDIKMVELTGFDLDITIEPEEKDDQVPDVPEEPTSKLGDIYQLGEHRLMCGDSVNSEDVEKLMEAKSADKRKKSLYMG